MSRIRGIEAKVQLTDVLQTRKNLQSDNNKNKNEDQSTCPKDAAEKQQITELLSKLPKLEAIFSVHRKIGEGTFSSVYLGSLRRHDHLPAAQRRWFALKHLVPTAHPARVEHELRCLRDMGGKNHVIGVDLCLRHFDTIVFVMPYIPHKKFSEYMADMDAAELREYMRALLTALQHVHSFGVIHRDVKPSNFLYDRENRKYLLVDFGLAQRVVAAPPRPHRHPPAPATPALPPLAPPPAHNNNTLKRARDIEMESGPEAKRLALDLSLKKKVPPSVTASQPLPQHSRRNCTNKGSEGVGVGVCVSVEGVCGCLGRGGVCTACSARPSARAPRAGTQGFRPPEVLLKVVSQSTAVDMWAAGVVLASVLSARYPFFRAADDSAALAELADLLGTKALQHTAHSLGRRLLMSVSKRGLCLRKLCARLRGALRGGTAPLTAPDTGTGAAPLGTPSVPTCDQCRLPVAECLCRDDTVPATSIAEGVYTAGFPDSAFALAASLLEPLPSRRPTAAQALQHPFFTLPL